MRSMYSSCLPTAAAQNVSRSSEQPQMRERERERQEGWFMEFFFIFFHEFQSFITHARGGRFNLLTSLNPSTRVFPDGS